MEGHVPVTLCKLYGLDRIHESLSSQAMTIQTVSDEQNSDPQEQRKGAFINLNLNCWLAVHKEMQLPQIKF